MRPGIVNALWGPTQVRVTLLALQIPHQRGQRTGIPQLLGCHFSQCPTDRSLAGVDLGDATVPGGRPDPLRRPGGRTSGCVGCCHAAIVRCDYARGGNDRRRRSGPR